MAHVVVAPDKFKGSLPAPQVADCVIRGLRAVDDSIDAIAIPVADGGEGTLAAALAAGFTRVPVVASGPTGRPVQTAYARRDGMAVIEMADDFKMSSTADVINTGTAYRELYTLNYGTSTWIARTNRARAAFSNGIPMMPEESNV